MVGVLNIIKPPHTTSHDVVAIARRALGTKKIGHTGTLDPMAAGVLPICIGRATKIVDLIQKDQKTYRCEMTLGQVTDTQDRWGTVLETRQVETMTKEKIQEVISQFIGEIEQVPPMFSALKVEGRKLYELAREGLEVKREPRIRTIYKIEIVRIQQNRIWMDVTCSKGTYIRTLCHDIGETLGCGAHMSFLLRTATGVFNLDNAISIETLHAMKDFPELISRHMWSVDQALDALPAVYVPEMLENKLKNGVRLNLAEYAQKTDLNLDQLYRIYIDETFIGVAACSALAPPVLKIEKLFSI